MAEINDPARLYNIIMADPAKPLMYPVLCDRTLNYARTRHLLANLVTIMLGPMCPYACSETTV